jgi:hypothetical protein
MADPLFSHMQQARLLQMQKTTKQNDIPEKTEIYSCHITGFAV